MLTALRPQPETIDRHHYGRGAQDGHLDFHTVPAGAGSESTFKKKKKKKKNEYQSTPPQVITAAQAVFG